MKRNILTASLAAVLGATLATVAMASPPSGVSPTLLARGTYDAFKVKADGPIEFEAEAKPAIDLVVRRHDYQVGGQTGWHTHPGPVFITVKEGTLTYYEYDDPSCTPHVVSAGQGFVDNGSGHLVRNEGTVPAQDVSVIVAPVGGLFRGELAAPNPNCGF